ncbi:MAG: DnaJ domain-containing protein [Deltaproteobacteria bacterium]|jgi:DnaJ-class molecular chaperone|nr:DnaJ domain-containing protein [Deltaproteobacteria bacterium]
MNPLNPYRELGLVDGASEGEIRAAFRRLAKTHHPDAAGRGPEDVERFRRAYKAYKDLLKKNVAGRGEDELTTPFVFEGQRTVGLDVYYDLFLVRPQAPGPFKLTLPWSSQQACPRCLGQGSVLTRLDQGPIFRPHRCERCGGAGKIARRTKLSVAVSEEMAARGKFRLRRAGGYLPGEARRGDLIVTIKWVDRLPVGH